MSTFSGSQTFQVSADAYDQFMGRYSRPLAAGFAEAARVSAGDVALDAGCGPGSLTGELVARLGAGAVCACDPTPAFVDACAARHPGVDVREGRCEAIPFEDGRFDRVLAQLVLHFVSEPLAAVAEMRRVARHGGTIVACVWDFAEGMEMLRLFWDAALTFDPAAPDEARTLRFGREGEIVALFAQAGLVDVAESTLTVESTYRDFDELWCGFLAGVGPAGAYCASLPADGRDRLRDEMRRRLGSPSGAFSLQAVARCAVGHVPR